MTQDQLFGRKWSVVVASAAKALDLSEMHITFNVQQSDVETPNSCLLRIYNLKEETANDLKKKEYDRVVVKAGYENGPYGLIFDGQIKQVRIGKENQIDNYVDILAADGDEAYNFAVVRQTLAAGATVKDQVQALAGSMDADGVKLGQMPEFANIGNPELIRGKVLFGLSKDYMRYIAQSNNARWSIQNGKLTMIDNTGYLEATPVVLTSNTGLIGLPEQTQSGILAKSLLNPKLAIGCPVRIDNKSIQRAQFDVAYGALNLFPSIAADGLYRVIVSEFSGDTRGDDWYSDLICLSIDPAVAPNKAVNEWP